MDFFQRQEDARRRSRRLLYLYVPLVSALCLGPGLVYAFLVKRTELKECVAPWAIPPERRADGTLVHDPAYTYPHEKKRRFLPKDCEPETFKREAQLALLIAAFVALGAWFKLSQLRKDAAGHLANLLDAKPIPLSGAAPPDEKKLANIVAEMCIAAGMPLPQVFLLPRETSINAFAAGSDVLDASIFVTRGALDRLTREELQGVIGHELGHVISGDVRVNMFLLGLLHGILLVHEFGSTILEVAFSRRSVDGERGRIIPPLVPMGFAFWLLGFLGLLCAQLLKAGYSRQREWAADALSVQFTRNPSGLASALGRILADARNGRSSVLTAAHAEQVSHMCIARAVKTIVPSLATHPPLEERIAALGGNPDRLTSSVRRPDARSIVAGSDPSLAGLQDLGAFGLGSSTASTVSTASVPSAPSVATASAALSTSLAAAVRSDSLPSEFASASPTPATGAKDETDRILRGLPRTPDEARVAFIGTLLWQNPSSQEVHLDYLSRFTPPHLFDRVRTYASSLSPRGAAEVVATCDVSLAVLRSLPAAERKAFVKGLEEFVRVDGRVSFFEVCLVGLARSLLGTHAGLSITVGDPRKLFPHVRVLVSMLAWIRTSFVDSVEADARRMSIYGHAMETFLGNPAPADGAPPPEPIGRYFETKDLSPERVWTALETISLGRPTLRARIAAAISVSLQGPKAAGEEGDLRLFTRVIALHLNALGVA